MDNTEKRLDIRQGSAPIGEAQIKELLAILQKYKAGKSNTDNRIVQSEEWWKLRNSTQERRQTEIGADQGFTSKSGWLHNVIVSKHADVTAAFPEPNILPREEGDRAEAKILSSILPCILEQNGFEKTYSDVAWQKIKTGTGVYKVVWDGSKLNGLGDINIERCNILNLYWEPGIEDIQKSRYFFHTELWDRDVLEERYPQLKGQIKNSTFVSTKFLYDDSVDTTDKVTVIDCYYHKMVNGKQTLQFVKFVNDVVIDATENNPELAQRGLYDHRKIPYVFDVLFPVEGSPCGYGYVDLCRNPQTEIDLLKTAFLKNGMVGATPRYFIRQDGSINRDEFLDLSNPLVTVNGNLGEDTLRPIDYNPLAGIYVNVLDHTISELRETSGNTETATGSNTPSGVTAASAIAALQEASGKSSKDSIETTYRAYGNIIDLTIELIRQFYDLPRQFRIVGEYARDTFITYSNQYIKPQYQGNDFGADMGYRLPVFDVKVVPQKRNAYTKISQNEMALQFFQLGFFNPQMTDQTLMCLKIMDFDGKEQIVQQVSQMGTMYQKLLQYQQLALTLAQMAKPELVPGLSQDIMSTTGMAPQGMASASAPVELEDGEAKEHPFVENARAASNNASQPDSAPIA